MNKKGSALILAIGVMMVLAFILAGILPQVTTEMRLARMNSDIIAAQAAADAGLRRAIADFYRPVTGAAVDWSWLGNNQTLTNSSAVFYTTIVKKGNNLITPESAPASGRYTIYAAGYSNGVERTASVAINVTHQLAENPLFDKVIYGYRTVTVDHGAGKGTNSYINGGVLSNTGVAGVNENTIFNPPPVTDTTQDNRLDFSGPFAPGNYWYGDTSIINTTTNFHKSLYYYDKYAHDDEDLVLGGPTTTLVSSAPKGLTVIYVNGNLSIAQNTAFDANSSFMFIVNGAISVGQHVHPPNIVLVANGDVTIEQQDSFNGSVIANGFVSVKQQGGLSYSAGLIDNLNGIGAGYSAITVPGSWR